MARDILRGYLQLASGIGELTRARAVEAAGGLLDHYSVGAGAGKVSDRVTALADELMAASSMNRNHIRELVRREVDAAVSRLGLVSATEVEQARAQVTRLQAQVAQLRPPAGAGPGTAVKRADDPTAGPGAALGRRRPRSAAPRSTGRPPRSPSTTSAAAGGRPDTAAAAQRDSVDVGSTKDRAAQKSAAKKALRTSGTRSRAATKTTTSPDSVEDDLDAATKKTARKRAVANKTATEKPATEKTATEKTATNKTATEKPATKRTATNRTATEPATKRAATKRAATKRAATKRAARKSAAPSPDAT